MENLRRYFSIFEARGGNFFFHLKFTFWKKWSKRIQRTKIQIGVAGVIFYFIFLCDYFVGFVHVYVLFLSQPILILS